MLFGSLEAPKRPRRTFARWRSRPIRRMCTLLKDSTTNSCISSLQNVQNTGSGNCTRCGKGGHSSSNCPYKNLCLSWLSPPRTLTANVPISQRWELQPKQGSAKAKGWSENRRTPNQKQMTSGLWKKLEAHTSFISRQSRYLSVLMV